MTANRELHANHQLTENRVNLVAWLVQRLMQTAQRSQNIILGKVHLWEDFFDVSVSSGLMHLLHSSLVMNACIQDKQV